MTTTTPNVADWWMVWLTGAGVGTTGLLGFLTLRANKRANDATQKLVNAQLKALEPEPNATLRVSGITVTGTPVTPVSWAHRRVRSDQYAFKNIGTVTARDVVISGPNEGEGSDDLVSMYDKPTDVDPQNEIPFIVARTFDSDPVSIVYIRWNEDDGPHEKRIGIV